MKHVAHLLVSLQHILVVLQSIEHVDVVTTDWQHSSWHEECHTPASVSAAFLAYLTCILHFAADL